MRIASILFVSLFPVLSALATPLIPRQAANSTITTTTSDPTVTIYPSTSDGQGVPITGTNFPLFQQDAYLGIPFAAPPIGDLRFTPPQDADWSSTSNFTAQTQPPACLQRNGSATAYGTSEDCLYLNVIVPEGNNAQTGWLPVVVWVYGGSFTSGAASLYNGTFIVYQGAQSALPVIYVAINYRLGIFGFPNGQEALENGAANLGLRDVIKALDWVQENIWAFGGDPSRVTVAGESAGAILISQLYLNESISSFSSAIMESGAQSVAPLTNTANNFEGAYNATVGYAGCTNATDSFACLKALPAQALLNASLTTTRQLQYSGFVFAPSVDGDLIPASPHQLLAEGKFAKIPFISGNNRDEGTAFVPSPAQITSETLAGLAISVLEPIPPNSTVLAELFGSVYPDVPALGSPYGTGNETFGYPSEFKQLAAILGDATFQSSRRWFLEQANAYGLTKTWSYLFTAIPAGTPAYLGSYHGIEIPYVFGIPQAAQLGISTASLGVASSYSTSDAALSQQIINYWLNFIYYTDPSGSTTTTSANATYWPAYGSNQTLLQFNTSGLELISDTYRQSQMEFFLDRPAAFNLRRSVGAQV